MVALTSRSTWILVVLVPTEGRQPENPEKKPRSKERTNNKLNPHETASTGNRTRVTEVGEARLSTARTRLRACYCCQEGSNISYKIKQRRWASYIISNHMLEHHITFLNKTNAISFFFCNIKFVNFALVNKTFHKCDSQSKIKFTLYCKKKTKVQPSETEKRVRSSCYRLLLPFLAVL